MKVDLPMIEFLKAFETMDKDDQIKIIVGYELQYKEDHPEEYCKGCKRKLK